MNTLHRPITTSQEFKNQIKNQRSLMKSQSVTLLRRECSKFRLKKHTIKKDIIREEVVKEEDTMREEEEAITTKIMETIKIIRTPKRHRII